MVHNIGQGWMWAGFILFIVAMLMVDIIFLGGGKSHKVSLKEALIWTGVWVFLAFLFNGLLWWYLQHTQGVLLANQKALEFFTGYVIEKSLSVDNIFVFIMIFHYFSVPLEYQQRVLLYGVLGAIVMRLALILVGTWLVANFHWIFYLFGLFLLFTGVKMLVLAENEQDIGDNPVLKFLSTHLRVTKGFHQERFFVKQNHRLYVTPLFLVVICIEVGDLVFAADSIPAIFAITTDPFIVFTSNIFAILGLRALYFVLADIAERFALLKYGLAIVLMFVGVKMLIMDWFKVSTLITLVVILLVLGSSIFLSMIQTRHKRS